MRLDVKWLCEHTRTLEKYSGRSVVCHPQEGRINAAFALEKIPSSSFVLHVPSKKELSSPVIVVHKK